MLKIELSVKTKAGARLCLRMRSLVAGVFVIVCFACTDSRETRTQRFLLKGNEQLKKGNDTQAIGYYQAALELDSCFADAWNNLGTVYYRQENYARALDSYQHALFCRPGYTDALLNRANTYYELKQYYSALQDLEEVARKHPDTLAVHFSRGLVYTQLRAYSKAIASFRKALALDPDNPELLINIGTIYYYRHQLDSANLLLHEALQLDPDQPNAYNTLALMEVQQGDYAQAMKHINMALVLKEKDDPYFLNNRGYVYLMQGELDKALADINESIVNDPRNAWAYRNKGIYYLKRGDAPDAIRLLRQALDMSAFIDKIHFYLAEAYRLNGEQQKACEHFRTAVEKHEITQEQFRTYCE